MRWPSTQTINEKSTNPNGINNALFDLLSKLNTTYQELSNVPRIVDSDTYGRYRAYLDGTTQGRTVTTSVVRSAGVALTSNVVSNVSSFTLPRGSWMLGFEGVLEGGAATTVAASSGVNMGITKTSATRPATDTRSVPTDGEVEIRAVPGVALTGPVFTLSSIPYRVDLTEDTTFYLYAITIFAVSTMTAFGTMQAVSIL